MEIISYLQAFCSFISMSFFCGRRCRKSAGNLHVQRHECTNTRSNHTHTRTHKWKFAKVSIRGSRCGRCAMPHVQKACHQLAFLLLLPLSDMRLRRLYCDTNNVCISVCGNIQVMAAILLSTWLSCNSAPLPPLCACVHLSHAFAQILFPTFLCMLLEEVSNLVSCCSQSRFTLKCIFFSSRLIVCVCR